ncbi:MAG TPA: heavy metal translocating P-type ATPase, partial [Bacteroidia bacterium]|nr:heavy metal translocating P-type ATPase [Bacteroidia bacterium]
PAKGFYSSKYNYLNNAQVAEKLIWFTDGKEAHVVFYLPKIHCSSCIWLLENLHRLNNNISSSTVNFLKKEATIVFDVQKIKLPEIVQLLAHIGYEPLINLGDLDKIPARATNTNRIIKIGIAGFCFGNIMMLSFPEYFSFGDFHEQANLQYFFAYLNLVLSLPVFFYSASDFFISAWKSIRYRYLNIDAPIALAIVVTFFRSVYEILSHTGVGYMDSMSGIVFFMLIGRYFQNQTYETLSFERDYKSYFPVGVTRITKNGNEVNQSVTDLKKGDRIVIRSHELIPSDSILISNQTHVDYSFITGESSPIKKITGELIYAGGKQLEGAIVLEVVNPTSQSYLTQLWNQDKSQQQTPVGESYIDKINKYFTIVVLFISLLTALYWLSVDSSKALNAMTAVLIVACPCGLLLTTTFAHGNILRILGRNKLYLKNSAVIDKLSKANTILFDKTGTITNGSVVNFIGPPLSEYEFALIASLAAQSSHPLSRKIHSQFNSGPVYSVTDFQEVQGKGIKGYIDGKYLILGSEYYVMGTALPNNDLTTKVFLMIDGEVIGYFGFTNMYRDGLEQLLVELEPSYDLQLISGDNAAEREKLKSAFGKNGKLFFNQKPEEKMTYVKKLKTEGKNVMMIGDGLNDAGALKQSDVGIAVSDDTNNFSPACDAILDGSSFSMLPAFMKLAKSAKKVIITTFIISLIYNVTGLTFAVQGTLAPVIAAILMPISSISIVLVATLSTTFIAKIKGLRS